MAAVGNIYILVGRICERGSKITNASGIRKIIPSVNDTFVSIGSKVNKGIEIAKTAAEQIRLRKDTGITIYDKLTKRLVNSGINIFGNLIKDKDFVFNLTKYCLSGQKRIPIPKNMTQLFQLMIEQTTGTTKLAQIVSDNKEIMKKLPFSALREAVSKTKAHCFFSRNINEAQTTLNQAFPQKSLTITKELSSASISDVYLVRDSQGKSSILKMLKKGLTKERLELEEKLYLRIAKEFAQNSREYSKYKEVISNCYSEFIGALSFSNEFLNNKLLSKRAKRFRVAKITGVSQDGSCIIMQKANGIRMDKLITILQAYKQNPSQFSLRYAEEISRNPWLAAPQKVIDKLPDTIIKTFDEQFMFLKKGGKSVMHGDPHSANFFITADKKGRLIPEFIDTGSCIVRTDKQILDDIKLCSDYYIGNTKGIASYYVEQCKYKGADKEKFTLKLAQEFEEKVFSKKKITDIKLVFSNINSILNDHGLTIPLKNINAIKAQLQFYSAAQEAAKLSEKPLNVLTIIKDLPTAVIKMFFYGKNPISPMMETIKYGFKNIEKAVGASFQFTSKV